jgi:rubrerythrin
VGGRSRVAAQMLSGRGFTEVYNLSGGIRAWEGTVIAGSMEVGMGLITGKETPGEMLLIAYAMEGGMRSFYEEMGNRVEDPEVAQLFGDLAEMDMRHQEMIFALFRHYQEDLENTEELEERVLPRVMEGGMTTEELLSMNQTSLETLGDVLTLAMMLEAQALDLYQRYAQRSRDPGTKEVLNELANQEKAHLASLGNLRERY